MRFLWIVFTLLLIGGAVALVGVLRGSGSGAPGYSDTGAAEAQNTSRGAREFAASLAQPPSDATPAPSPDPSNDFASAPDSPSEPPAVSPDMVESIDPQSLAAELLASSAERDAAGHSAADGAARQKIVVPDDAPRLTDGLDASIPGVTIVPGVVVRLEDGSIRADDRFTIRGGGSAEDPYLVTWELLMSAGELYQPRLGKLEIPQRVALLHGHHVRIDGYAAFPIFSFDPKEMLAMLNQWDGCCIGVPPTPYDAIEVKLASAPRDRKRQLAYFGTTTGKLSVEPYLVENWLVGLYLMDDAAFTMDM